jgi:hypothetical protein
MNNPCRPAPAAEPGRWIYGFVEQLVLVVGLVGDEQAIGLPFGDRLGVDAEPGRGLDQGEETPSAKPLPVAGKAVVTSQPDDLAGRELTGVPPQG